MEGENIEIKQDASGIIHTQTETLDEKTLVEKYRQQYTAFRIQEAKLQQLPGTLKSMEMYVQITNRQLEINEHRQKQLKDIFYELNTDTTKEIKILKEKYDNDELLNHTNKVINNTKSTIEKRGTTYFFKTEVESTVEDMLVELMTLQNSRVGLLEQLIKQNKQYETMKNSQSEMEKSKIKIQERLRVIKVFFAKQHKNIDQLLDTYAAARKKKDKVAEVVSDE